MDAYDMVGTGNPATMTLPQDRVDDESLNKASTVLPWDRFSNWIHCACVVTFDLELGQAMEVSPYYFDQYQ